MDVQYQETSDIVSDSLIALELPSVLEEVAAHALSAPGKAKVLDTLPEENPSRVVYHLDLVTQFKEAIRIHGTLNLAGLVPIEGILKKLENSSAVLDSEEILVVSDLLHIARNVRSQLEALDEHYNFLSEQAPFIIVLNDLRSAIIRTLDEHGNVRPNASPRLTEIHERTLSVRENIRNRLERIIQDRDLARIVQEDYITLRSDRYVILLRPEFKSLLDGIVHDHSRSGASVYVEPFEVVDLNNQIASLMDEEREEIRRIFVELTEKIRFVRDEIAQDYEILAWLDAFQARALYAIATAGIAPQLVESGFKLLGARHPLLPSNEVVPMDVVQAPATLATIISGANMGGKTVALKIAGLFPLMTRCGILLPAKEGTELQLFTKIMADIGEEQDIRSRISSFSSHILKMKAVLDTASAGTLILLDELGGATDPDEGSALAMAIIDELIQRGARVVVTTHLVHLKAYAFSRPDVKNVSVEFHPETMQPTYRLLYDLPGESHAILTAERLGLAESVIRTARSYLDRSAGGSSRLLEQLRTKLVEVDQLKSHLEDAQHSLDNELEKIRAAREETVEEFRKTAADMLKRAERQIRDLQQSLKSGKIKEGSRPIAALKEIKEDIVKTLGVPLEKKVSSLQAGSRVRIKSLGREGVVHEVLDKGRIEVAIGGIRIKADTDDVVELSRPVEKKSLKNRQIGVNISPATPRWEVNVIGLRADEAIPIVEKAIDEALVGGLTSLNIIHGKGTGRLRKAIWDYLSGHSMVKSFNLAESRIGGEGVTVVEIASE